MLERPESEECPWIAVEGLKTVLQLAGGLTPQLVLHCQGKRAARLPGAAETVQLTPALFRALSRVDAPQEVIAFFDKPSYSWEQMPPWLLYLDRLRDPGNLGTLLRTAAATGFGVATSAGTVSVFNAKVVRASAGSLFETPFLQGVPVEEAKERGYRLCAASARGADSLFELPLEPPCAFAVGNEGAGLAEPILDQADASVRIPMVEGVESLNAGVVGSLIMFEVVRRGR